MIRKGITVLFINVLCVSCGTNDQSKYHANSKVNDVKVIVNNKNDEIAIQENNVEVSNSFFDWSKFHHLKVKLFFKLKQQEVPEDQAIMQFLDDYTLLENEYNSVLHAQDNYKELNTLAYTEDGKVTETAKIFKRQVEENGFSIAQEEGMIFLSKNPQFLQNQVLDLVNSTSQKFLELYSNEIDSVCCSDAGIVISTNMLIKRIYEWGELSRKTEDTKYNEYVQGKLKRNLYLLFQGLDNTPAFDWTSKKIRSEIFIQMNDLIKKNPNSIAAKEFQIYVDLLNQENLKNTIEVKKFLQQKFN